MVNRKSVVGLAISAMLFSSLAMPVHGQIYATDGNGSPGKEDGNGLTLSSGQSVTLSFPEGCLAVDGDGVDIILTYTGNARIALDGYDADGGPVTAFLQRTGPLTLDLNTYGQFLAGGVYSITISPGLSDVDLDAVRADNYTCSLQEVDIDIKPGNDDNVVNIDSQGVVTVAILSSASSDGTIIFDATTVVPESVTLAGADVAIRGKGALATQKDVNGDGLIDLEVKVETEYLEPDSETGEAIVEGETADGTRIQGSDHITVVPS